MYRRLEWLRDCGFFTDYQWDSGLPDFARINVIYGPTGTGKTSLACAFDGLRHSLDGAGHQRLSAVVDGPTRRTTGGNDDAVFDRTLVFSEDFVRRSHNFAAGSADMPAVLTVGERSTEAERELKVLRKEHEEQTSLHRPQLDAEKTANTRIETLYGLVSQQVVDAASRAGGRWRSRGNYSARVVRNAFEASHLGWSQLSDEELQAKIAIVNSDNSDTIPTDPLVVAPSADLRGRAEAAIQSTPVTVVLETLAKHPEATTWVSDGRDLHEGIDECVFCGSDLTDERRSAIDAHFSDAVKSLESDLEILVQELENLASDVDTVSSSIPSRGLLFEDLRPRHAAAASGLRSELKLLREWATQLRGRVEAKLKNVLAPVDHIIDEPPAVTAAEMLKLLEEHNERVRRHDEQVQESAKAIESHYLKVAEQGVAKATAEAKAAADSAGLIEQEIAALASRITTLESVDGDPQPSARVLTEEVARLLGRRELEFTAEGDRYQVTRSGLPAEGLSLGERTAISLVHFLEMVACFDPSNGRPIVVIDDPVSSLDSDIFMGVSTYIWTESVAKDHIAQLFMFTHNFELFRQWDIQIEALHKAGRDDDGRKISEVYPSAFYEIRPRVTTKRGVTRRRPHLVAWPPSSRARKMVRSTYHQAFMTLADAKLSLLRDDSLEQRLSAQLLFPNVIRRMLETFLAFKHPEWVGNLATAMRNSAELLRAANYSGDPDALRLRLTRYAHAYSHSETPATDIVVSPDEVASAISSVFEFMNCLDTAHFIGLCEAVDIDPSTLLMTSTGDVQAVSDRVEVTEQ